MPRKNTPPSYRFHKARNCAVVTIRGRNYYLGEFGSVESKQRYSQLIAEEWADLKDLPDLPANRAKSFISIDELIARYMTKYVVNHYVNREGKASERQYHIKAALRPLHELFGHLPANEFGPKKLKLVREHLIKNGTADGTPYARTYINDLVTIVKDVFRWGVEEEVVPVEIHQSLLAVQQIRKGRDRRLKEKRKVLPVLLKHINATIPFLAPQLAAMVQLQLHAAMRPDEVSIMRPCDIDQSGKTWVYHPDAHKTEHHDISREIPLGPKCRAILTPWLQRQVDQYLFSPREVVEASIRSRRKNPSDKPVKMSYDRAPREHYDDETYCRAVKRACKRAGVPIWTPNQLRHTAATFIREKYDLEAAKIILGHQSAVTTEIYAEKDLRAAMEIIESIG